MKINSIYNKDLKNIIDCEVKKGCEYIKENINKKASTKEIFVACRTGKSRYNHKWKQIPKNKI